MPYFDILFISNFSLVSFKCVCSIFPKKWPFKTIYPYWPSPANSTVALWLINIFAVCSHTLKAPISFTFLHTLCLDCVNYQSLHGYVKKEDFLYLKYIFLHIFLLTHPLCVNRFPTKRLFYAT